MTRPRRLRAAGSEGGDSAPADGGANPAQEAHVPPPVSGTASISAARLATGTGLELPVSVRNDGDKLLLMLLVEPGEMLGAQVEEVVFESMSPRGLIRVRGWAERLEDHLVSFEALGAPELLQRRQYFRVVSAQRVRIDPAEGEQIVTSSIDISGGGMLLAGPTLSLDSVIDFRVFLEDNDPPITGSARVVRAASQGRRGIVFEQISKADRERLIHFVFDRQRKARAKTRGDLL